MQTWPTFTLDRLCWRTFYIGITAVPLLWDLQGGWVNRMKLVCKSKTATKIQVGLAEIHGGKLHREQRDVTSSRIQGFCSGSRIIFDEESINTGISVKKRTPCRKNSGYFHHIYWLSSYVPSDKVSQVRPLSNVFHHCSSVLLCKGNWISRGRAAYMLQSSAWWSSLRKHGRWKKTDHKQSYL